MNIAGPFIPYFVSVAAISAVGEGNVTTILNFTLEGGQYSRDVIGIEALAA